MKTAMRLLAGAMLVCGALPAMAQTSDVDSFPTRPIRVIVPYAAGGSDTYIRPLTNVLENKHKITLVIESVTGAGGAIGSSQVKRSAPDGYTLLFCGTGAMTIVPKLNKVDYTMADFEPILNLIAIPYVLAVKKDAPYKTFAEMVTHLKANPVPLTYGSPGVGSAPYLAMEAVAERLKLPITHVPYAGIAPAVVAIVGGHVDAVIGAPNNVLPQVRSGNLTALAVSSKERFKLAAEIPTFTEQGADIDVVTNFGFLAPKGTPPRIIQKLAAAIRDAASDPQYIATMEGIQNNISVLPADAFAKALVAEEAYFAPVIEKLAKKQ
jgi:tripartite-type tricarboxylate transporter receptor subunit TctC